MFSASLSGGWDFGSARASGVSASSPVVAAPAATPRTINDFTASAAGDARRTLAADVIVAAAPDPVFVSDLRGKILEANEVVSQLLGLRRDEVPHMAWQLSELTVLEPKDITRASRLTMTKSDARWPALSSPRQDRRDGVVLTRGAPSCAGWIDGCRTGRSCPCA
ncbi:MAG: hypothetical protein DMD80_23060 [Candidatus Rokuibacteriota bacterium]|nr:MAG: hypothetical protein DMD80_23060 [Candidatus Rokubacteria bacterium]